MTRVHSSPSSPKRGDISLTDTWPFTRNKGIKLHSFPPWEAPEERKTRSTSKSGRDCYDPHERNIYTPVGGEVATHNKFSPLVDYNDKMKETLHDNKKPSDKEESRGKPEDRRENDKPRRNLPIEDYTPKRRGTSAPRRRLYENIRTDQGKTCDENMEVVPLDTDLEVLLINSCKIDAVKVQTIIDEFMTDKDYATIFCMTETKVEGHEFQPEGVKIFSKHRGRKDKKGGA